jgi:hypothetical protein
MFDDRTGRAERVWTLMNPSRLGDEGPEVLPLVTAFRTAAGIGLGASAAEVRQAHGSSAGHSPLESWMRFPEIGLSCSLSEGRVIEMTVLRAQEP